MHVICGTLTLEFAAKVSREVLLEEFNTFLIKIGTVNLKNYSNENLELEIQQHEIEYLEDIEGDNLT